MVCNYQRLEKSQGDGLEICIQEKYHFREMEGANSGSSAPSSPIGF